MKRRQLLLSLSALAGATPAAAQSQFRRVAKGDVLRGRFAQERQLKGFERPLLSDGDFVLAEGLGLIWRTEHPFAILTVITAAGLIQNVDGTETTRLPAARLPFLARLYDLLGAALSGDWQSLEAMFQVTRHGDTRQWDLVLVPRGAADPLVLPFRSIALRGGQFLDAVRITRLDGDADVITFSGQTLGGALSGADATWLREAGK